MIEQAAATKISELALQQQDKTTLLQADQADVQRFSLEMQDNFRTDVSEQLDMPISKDVKVSHPDGDLLTVKQDGDALHNPVMQIDQSYKSILSQINNVPDVDTFLDYSSDKSSAKVRTNVEENTLPELSTQELLEQMQEMRVSAKDFTKDMSRWHTKMQMFSVNMSVLTSLVSQASQGFKTLFRSSG